MEHEAPAKVEPSGEETLSDPAKREKIVLQIRRRLSMREAARRCQSPAIAQLIGMKAPQLPEATQSRAVAQLLGMKAHHAIIGGNRYHTILALAITISLGIVFTALQAME